MTHIRPDIRPSCLLLIQPGNPDHEGEKLESLARGARQCFGHVTVVMDNAACGNTLEDSARMAWDWLARNGERIDECGVSLERMVRWSEFPFYANVLAELESLYKSSRNIRQVMNALAIEEAEPGNDELFAVREVLPKIFRRVAGLVYMKNLSNSPVVGAAGMPSDSYILENAGRGVLPSGSLVLPDVADVNYTKPVAKPAVPAATRTGAFLRLVPN